MISQRKTIITGSLGVLSLIASIAAIIGVQVCFVYAFFLNAIVFPINPRAVLQPTAMRYWGTAFEIAFPFFLLAGAALMIAALRYWWLMRSHGRAAT